MPTRPLADPIPTADAAAVLRERTARRLVARLDALPIEASIEERLRAAREQALDRARERRLRVQAGRPIDESSVATTLVTAGSGAGAPGPLSGWWDQRWWRWLGSAVPLAALVLGLLAIRDSTERARIRAAATIDAALLADDLPPGAYSDPAFVEFLTSERRP